MDITIKKLTKIYGEKVLFRDYSVTIPEGNILAIMGSSGLGKTTLLRLLAGLEEADAGEITGIPEKISMVFQENRLCEELSAMENIRLVLPKTVRKNKEQAAGQIRRHLLQVGLDADSLNQPISEYSGGMKRRVAVVRAIMAESELLLMDEPCNGLDADTRQKVIQYILEQRQGRTMVVVTHNEEEAEAYGGEILHMETA